MGAVLRDRESGERSRQDVWKRVPAASRRFMALPPRPPRRRARTVSRSLESTSSHSSPSAHTRACCAGPSGRWNRVLLNASTTLRTLYGAFPPETELNLPASRDHRLDLAHTIQRSQVLAETDVAAQSRVETSTEQGFPS